jgi:sigma-B regulation protein RsbU (phosphoserine phosphatase)
MSEIDESEAFAAFDSLRDRLIIVASVITAIVIFVSYYFSLSLTQPLRILGGAAERLTQGKLDEPVQRIGRDEIGDLAQNFEKMRQTLRELIEGLETKVAERTQDLQDSETRVRTIIESAADGIVVIGTNGVVQSFSPAAELIFGYGPGEVIGKKVNMLMPEPARSEHDHYLERYFQTGEKRVVGRNREVIGLRKDGMEFPMELAVGEAVLGNEHIFVGIIRDITERKKAERATAEAMAKLQVALSSMSDGIYILDSGLKFIAFNQRYIDLLNFPEGVVKEGQSIAVTVKFSAERGDYSSQFEGSVDDIIAARLDQLKSGKHLKIENVTPTGRIVEYNGSPTRDGGTVVILRDITERKQSEKAIADQLAFNLALIDAIPNPMFVKNPDTKFVAFNKAYEEAFGIERDRYIDKTVMELEHVPPEARQVFQKEDETLLDEGGIRHRELSIVLADDHEHHLLYWTRTFDLSDGERGGLLGVLVDITRQKDLERELSIANKRMGDELNIGRQIQMSMIPLTFPRFPEHKDLDVWAFIRPAREVGGDFYDFFFINERLFAFVVADVSGKGVPAALLMAVAKTLLKSNSQETQSTARIIERTNNELSQNNPDCMFITAFFGIIDTKTGVMTYTNAGHNPPYLMSPDGSVNSLVEVHGPMMGVMEGTTYGQTKRTLGVDDKLVLYTDGVTEAFNPDGELFGEERLSEFLIRSDKLGTKYLVDALVRDIDDFAGDEEQSDDITVFCLRYVAWDVRDDRAKIELHLTNEMSEIDRCLKSLNEFCDRFNLPPEVRNDFGVVLDDLLNNIISYAFEDEDEHLIEVSLATDKQRLIVTLSDDGVEFDPFLRGEADVDSGIKDRQIGGLGIHLARSLMDDFSYRRINGKNVTILMKRMGDSPSDQK